MDWTSVITALIAALIPTGGLLAIVTMTEKKSGLMLQNAKELADSYKALAEEYQAREAKTQQMLVEKEEALMLQVKMNSSLRHALDDSHTETAVAKIMFCKNTKCINRDPPFGCNADLIVEKLKENTRRSYEGGTKRKNNGSESDADGAATQD